MLSYYFVRFGVNKRAFQPMHEPRSRRLFNTMFTNCPDLRILFCGSDQFSSASLEALATAQRSEQLPIKSIDVVCRPPKRVGRGLKETREVPIIGVANSLQLPIHHVDTFTGWRLPSYDSPPINLIIAVSFGLFIPPRILQSVEYGGLNVHPSLLPDLRGAAPIPHALMAGDKETGVTVQTLHPSKFDHGAILAQKKQAIDPQQPADMVALTEELAKVGASLLVQSLKEGNFVPPITPQESIWNDKGKPPREAPKLKSESGHIKWNEWGSSEILRRDEVLRRTWSLIELPAQKESTLKVPTRIHWSAGLERHTGPSPSDSVPGSLFLDLPADSDRNGESIMHVYMATKDGALLKARICTTPGKPGRPARQVFQSLGVVKSCMLS